MKHLLFVFGILFVCYSCKKKPEPESVEIKNFTLTQTGAITVHLEYDIVLSGNPKIVEKGVICSVDATASIFNARFPESSSDEQTHKSFSIGVNSPNVTFYVRPYVITSSDTILGNVLSFQSGDLYALGVVNDVDGNQYSTVRVGTQTWMAENLRTTHYRNMDPIPGANSTQELNNATEGHWFYNNFNSNTEPELGKRYMPAVIIDNRNVCPTGWRIPNGEDIIELRDYLGNNAYFAGKLKSTGNLTEGTGNWEYPNYRASNESGLSMEPGGTYYADVGQFQQVTEIGSFAFFNGSDLRALVTYSYDDDFQVFSLPPNGGDFIRCIKE